MRHRIEDHVQGRTIKTHISKTDDMPLDVVEKIDWENILHASKLLTVNRKIWLVKHVSGFAATASKMMYRKEWDTDLCPLCNCVRETTIHHSVCRNEEITDLRMNRILQLQKWMKNNRTALQIIETITLAVVAGQNATFTEMLRETDAIDGVTTLVIEAANEQGEIGWHNFLKGRISSKWRQAQHTYLRQNNLIRQRSAKARGKNFLIQLYDMAYALWEFRNTVVTKVSKEQSSIRERNKLKTEIQKQYELGVGTLRPQDHNYLQRNMEDIQSMSTRAQKYWVRKCEVSRAYVEESERNMITGMRNIMNNWATIPD